MVINSYMCVCANIFVKYLLDICVFFIIVGMGRTCVYVHHVDKEAFLKGNVETDPDELDMVFDSSPSYAEVLKPVRKDLNWMDPSDIVELEGRHNVGLLCHTC